MNKPASELIALADKFKYAADRMLVHRIGIHLEPADMKLAEDALRTAAHQSSSERAGVDAYPRWRHKKRGTTYAEIGRGKIQSENWCNRTGPMDLPPVDMAEVVIYRSDDDGSLWVRPFIEFYDGRFEELATPPAQPAPDATHGKPDGAVREALRNLLDYAEQRECSHETTHRGGSIWTICDECGKKWADDRGGFIPYQEPKEITQARAALSPKIAAAEISPGDVVAMKEASKRAVTATLLAGEARLACAAIDRIDVKAEAKSQEPDAVAWQYQRADGEWCDCWKPNEIELKVAAKRFRALYTHPTTKPEAPAVSVEQLARTIATARGVNPDCLHQNYGDEPVDHEDAHGRTFHYGWRNQMHIAKPVAALIAGGR